ncbi:MAG: 4Fe-4S dicluster domain-containing protein [Promethearchaeota archaeon]
MSNKVLIIQAENCTGCRMCELACSSTKYGSFIPERSCIKIITNGLEGWSRPLVCVQCEEPLCMDACPTGAIYKKKTSNGELIVDFNSDLCTSCQQCIEACPFGAIEFSKDIKIIKCDLCDGSPKCVEFCSYKCLEFYELPEKYYIKRSNTIKSLANSAVGKINDLNSHQRRVKYSLDLANITTISKVK